MTLTKAERKKAEWIAANRDKVLAYKRKHNKRYFAGRHQALTRPEAIYDLVLKALERYPEFMRGELASDMIFAVLDGKLAVRDVRKRAPEFATKYNRQLDRFRTLSLDAPIRGMEGITYVDCLEDRGFMEEVY